MDNIIKIVLEGEPIAKQRPRFNTHSMAVYNPQKLQSVISSKDVKNRLPEGFKAILGHIPITCDCTFYMPIPKSNAKVIREGDPYLKKPDRDNLDKWVLDICNGVVWQDDCQVYDGRIIKLYSHNPRTEFVIKW